MIELVGGPEDGRRINVPDDATFWQVPILRPRLLLEEKLYPEGIAADIVTYYPVTAADELLGRWTYHD